MKIDFVIAGVMKGGTTALDHLLREHPALQMAAEKELHYFDDDAVDWIATDHSRLHDAFDWSGPFILRGEATPSYVYWPQSLERLRRYNPAVKIIIGLRHPAYRAYSHWKHMTIRGWETLSFAEAVGAQGRARVRLEPTGVHRVFSYVERSLYAEQIAAAVRLFPIEQRYVFRTNDLWTDVNATLADVHRLLGVEHRAVSELSRLILPIDTRGFPPMSAEDRATLDEIFRADLAETARLTGLDFSDWLDPGYLDPMPS